MGLINVQNPDASKILEFIKRQPEKPTLVSSQVRQEELNAFQAWIRAAVADPKLISSRSDRAIGPQVPEEVIVHARKDRVLQSFLDNIWTEVGRCAACHSPDQNAKQVKEHGESVSWITLNDPQATLDYMLDAGIINAEHPLESLLITKPTLQVEHGGGKKLVVGDRSYKQFRGFINDYSSVVKGAYRTVDSLPIESDEVSLVTDIWFKLTEVPAEYDKMLLQVDIYRWEGDSWSEYRVASSDRQVFGGGNLWQHSLSLTAPRQSDWEQKLAAKKLPEGKYLVKLYLDRTGKLQEDYNEILGKDDFVGQVEVQSGWPSGYGRMTSVAFPKH